MPRVDEIERGLLEGLGILAAVSISVFSFLYALGVPNPSADLLEGIATLGTGLLLAYVVEISWFAGRMRSESDYEKRLGTFLGLGTAGLAGIVVALLLASHRAAGHSNLLDSIGLAWVIASVTTLGGMVIMQPLLVHEWSGNQPGSD
ncbi:MAG TPA: hypothetical protein VID51_02395 [Solirubrobacterales bacterium]